MRFLSQPFTHMFLRIFICIGLLSAGFSLYSCEKEPGEGGTSSISGRVLVYEYDPSLMTVVDTVEGVDEDVFIIYGGDHSTYDDDYTTSYDGTYRFSGLRKGTYKLFCYSKDPAGLKDQTIEILPKVPIFVTVTIDENRSEVTAPDIIIYSKR